MSSAEPASAWSGPDDVSIGRQLHDIVVPQLFVLTAGLTALRRRGEVRAGDPLVDDLIETATQAVGALRAISRGESAGSADRVSAVVARLEAETRTIGQLTDCAVAFERTGDADIPAEFGLDLVAFVWEAIANALRHGDADHVVVCVVVEEDEFVVRVEDDGAWKEPTDAWGSGIRGLEARAARWTGRVGVAGSPEGTRIELRVSRAGVDQGCARR
ncbi:MAG: ATP-binding protein [Acidimicrobiales bacterium]